MAEVQEPNTVTVHVDLNDEVKAYLDKVTADVKAADRKLKKLDRQNRAMRKILVVLNDSLPDYDPMLPKIERILRLTGEKNEAR